MSKLAVVAMTSLSSMFTVLSTLGAPALAATIASTSVHSLDILNVPMQLSKISSNSVQPSTTEFSPGQINGANFELNGQTSIQGQELPFELSGTLTKDKDSNDIYGSVVDTTGNFNVVRFEITDNSGRGVSLWKGPTLSGGDVLKLYLEQSGTRNFVIIECTASDAIPLNALIAMRSNEDSFSPASAPQVIWEGKYFEPNSVTKKTVVVSQPTTSTGTAIRPSMTTDTTMQPAGVAPPLTVDQEYIDTYAAYGGGTDTDEMILQELTNEAQDSTSFVTGTLSVHEYVWTPASGSPEINDVTWWQVQGPGITLSTTPQSPQGEGINYAWTSGVLSQGGAGLGITLGYDPEVSYKGFHVGLTFSVENTYVKIGDAQDDCQDAGAAGEWAPSGDYMDSVNEDWGTTFNLDDTGFEAGTQNLNTLDYVYTMVNTWNNDNLGQQNDTVQWDVNL